MGKGASPRALSESWVSYPRPPRIWSASLASSQARSEFPHLGHGGFEADVECVSVRHASCELDRCFHGEGVGGHAPDLLRERVVLTDGLTPLHALRPPRPTHLERDLAGGRTEYGE